MLCNNTQFYDRHPVYPIRGWTFAYRVGPKGFEQMGGIFNPGVKRTKKQMREIKKTYRAIARENKLRARPPVDCIADELVVDPRFIHNGFPYGRRTTVRNTRKRNVRITEKDVPALIAAGYRRTSNNYRIVSRIDRPDWREYMAYQHAPWDPAGQGMRWVTQGAAAGDHYRRCYSLDKIELDDERIYKMFPGSGWDKVEYVEPVKVINGVAYA